MRTYRLLIVLCLTTAASLAAISGQAAPRAPKRPAPHATGAPRGEDREIEAAIRARFAKSKISTNKFEVSVQGGVATIEGHTGVIQHKGTATRLAKAAGARQVVNRIEVSEAARQRAAGNLAQGRRRAQLKRSESRSESR